LIGFLMAANALSAQPALAQSYDSEAEVGGHTGASTTAAAETLFEEGVRLADQGKLALACQKFEASEALDVAVGTLLRLADCQERTGKLASAWARFREAASLAQAQGMTDRARIATVRSAALEPKLSRLTISVPAEAPTDLVVTLNQNPVPRASWGSALPLDPGTLTIEAWAPGYVTYRREVALPPDSARVKVTIPPLEPKPSSQPRAIVVKAERKPTNAGAQGSSGYGVRVLGVTMLVLGGVGLGTSGALAVVANKRNHASLEYCPEQPSSCSARGVQLRDDAIRLADFATLSAAVGGGLVASGLVVYLLSPSERPQEQVSLAVKPEADGVSLRAAGAF
jgi:hypothetical protein